MRHYLQAGEAGMLAQHQAALVLDFARRRELDAAAVLKGTGLYDTSLPEPGKLLSAEACLRLLANVANVASSSEAPDTSFMLGQTLLPGHYGVYSQALQHATCLRQALDLLQQLAAPLCPLLTPRFRQEGKLAVLYWIDGFGAARQRGFLVEMHMAAVVGMCRWLSSVRLPWTFCFNRTPPRHTEQHQVHLGSDLRFHCQLDAMLIDAAWLDQPWPRGNAMAAQVALQQCAPAPAPAMLVAIYDYLLQHIRLAPTLEQTAQDFGISPATLKRHLARHGSHFQAELDQVRTHVALHLFHTEGLDNEAVANYLGFHDANNFRRSFKRWTGMTPMLLRQGLVS